MDFFIKATTPCAVEELRRAVVTVTGQNTVYRREANIKELDRYVSCSRMLDVTIRLVRDRAGFDGPVIETLDSPGILVRWYGDRRLVLCHSCTEIVMANNWITASDANPSDVKINGD